MFRRPLTVVAVLTALALCTPSVGGAMVRQDRAVPRAQTLGMAELMAGLGPNAICPRGACGFGRDGIPDPYEGGGWTAGSGSRADTVAATAFGAAGARLASWLTSTDLVGAATTANDIWGYVSPRGREYALIGLRSGTVIVDVTDAGAPVVIAAVPGASSDWRDIKTYREHAYVVNERGDGLQVIDLRKVDRGKVRLVANVTDGYLRTAHNIFINETSGFAYLLGSNIGRGGILVADLADPAHPRLLPDLWDDAYVHDIQVISYPRGRHAGREIAFAFTGPLGLHVIDVTDKSRLRTLSHLLYANATYGHSGSLDPTRRFLYVNDELDERSNPDVNAMTTYVIRVGDLANPRLVRTVVSDTTAIDHNSMVQGTRLYVSAYHAGLRIFDVAAPGFPVPTGFFDTYPDDDEALFSGAWGVFAGFPSGNVLVSDIERGLFVITPE